MCDSKISRTRAHVLLNFKLGHGDVGMPMTSAHLDIDSIDPGAVGIVSNSARGICDCSLCFGTYLQSIAIIIKY